MSDRSDGSWRFGRRTALRLTGSVALAGASAGTAVAGSRKRIERTCYVEQGGRTYEIEPLTGDVPVAELYDYRLPDEYEGVGVTSTEEPHYRSVGTKDLQEEATTVTFLYDGPNGLSLVVVHGRPGGRGGAVSWTVEHVPEGAEWPVKDDYYVDADTGERASNNYDRWETDGTEHRVDWTWGSHGTDGGALSDLGDAFSLTIRPAFNEDAELYGEHYAGRVRDWQVLSGDFDEPDRVPLDLDQPVTVACETTTQTQSWAQKWDDGKVYEDQDDEKTRRGDGERGGNGRGSYQNQKQSQTQRQEQSGIGGTQVQSQSQSQTQLQTGGGTQVQKQNQSQAQKQGLLKTLLGRDD